MLQNSSKTVRCWGENSQLGQGPEAPLYVGDDEPPSSIGPVDVGGAVIDLAVGDDHSCALLVGGGVRCWGSNIHGELGQGEIFFPGYFDGVPSAWPLVSLGDVPVVDIEAGGGDHTCALHEDHTVHCWGKGERGELGYGNGTTEYVGDDELPSSVGTVPVGGARRPTGRRLCQHVRSRRRQGQVLGPRQLWHQWIPRHRRPDR
jgi:alpha-tubulin suppressor-like RCC1 family protein